jgi:hypothetical protein
MRGAPAANRPRRHRVWSAQGTHKHDAAATHCGHDSVDRAGTGHTPASLSACPWAQRASHSSGVATGRGHPHTTDLTHHTLCVQLQAAALHSQKQRLEATPRQAEALISLIRRCWCSGCGVQVVSLPLTTRCSVSSNLRAFCAEPSSADNQLQLEHQCSASWCVKEHLVCGRRCISLLGERLKQRVLRVRVCKLPAAGSRATKRAPVCHVHAGV